MFKDQNIVIGELQNHKKKKKLIAKFLVNLQYWFWAYLEIKFKNMDLLRHNLTAVVQFIWVTLEV